MHGIFHSQGIIQRMEHVIGGGGVPKGRIRNTADGHGQYY